MVERSMALMQFKKFNQEGYADTTAQSALIRAEQLERENAWPVVYVCSAFRGDEKMNILRAREYCRFVVSRRKVPLAPHLLFPQFVDEQTERSVAMKMDCYLLQRCDELWAFGKVTDGMLKEIELAADEEKRVRYFTRDLKEVSH